MFDGCSGLTSLDVSNFDTSNVTDMGYMFDGCSGLTSLDVSGCSALKALYCQDNQLTSLGTLPSSIQTINCSNNMFKYLSITGISDLASLNAQDNTSMLTLNCKGNSLTTLLVSGCSALKSIDCSNNQFTTLPTLPSTIEQIDEQTRRMAQQIEELNNVYARMIKALTINMKVVPGTEENEK